MKIAVLSDIHGNHYALEKVLQVAKREKVERLLVLGDIVGYYYHPEKVLDMLGAWNYEFIKGNHEVQLKKLKTKEIEPESLRDKYGSGHLMAIDKLSEDQYNFLINAPEKRQIKIENTNLLMCHGSNWDMDYYLYPDASAEILKKCNEAEFDFVLVGHSHYAFAFKNQHSVLINAGSVGQSRTMGGVANWAIINTINKCFEIKSTAYNIHELLKEVKQIDPDISYLQEILKRNN